MNTIYKILALACAAAGFQSCEKDLQDEINDGKWNHERQVIDIKFENQIGVAEIEAVDATTGLIELSINVNAVPDLSNIKITNLQLSYQANSSVGIAMSLTSRIRSGLLPCLLILLQVNIETIQFMSLNLQNL